jgi:hypothetical protein
MIVFHHGESGESGHYTAFVFGKNDIWGWKVDDTDVLPMQFNDKSLKYNDAYGLFYEECPEATAKLPLIILDQKTGSVQAKSASSSALSQSTAALLDALKGTKSRPQTLDSEPEEGATETAVPPSHQTKLKDNSRPMKDYRRQTPKKAMPEAQALIADGTKSQCPHDGACVCINIYQHQLEYKHKCTKRPCPWLDNEHHRNAFIHNEENTVTNDPRGPSPAIASVKPKPRPSPARSSTETHSIQRQQRGDDASDIESPTETKTSSSACATSEQSKESVVTQENVLSSTESISSCVLTLLFGPEKKSTEERLQAGQHGAKNGILVQEASKRRQMIGVKTRKSNRSEALREKRQKRIVHEGKELPNSAAFWENSESEDNDDFDEEARKPSIEEPLFTVPDESAYEWVQNQFMMKPKPILPLFFDFSQDSFQLQKKDDTYDFYSAPNSREGSKSEDSRSIITVGSESATVSESSPVEVNPELNRKVQEVWENFRRENYAPQHKSESTAFGAALDEKVSDVLRGIQEEKWGTPAMNATGHPQREPSPPIIGTSLASTILVTTSIATTLAVNSASFPSLDEVFGTNAHRKRKQSDKSPSPTNPVQDKRTADPDELVEA